MHPMKSSILKTLLFCLLCCGCMYQQLFAQNAGHKLQFGLTVGPNLYTKLHPRGLAEQVIQPRLGYEIAASAAMPFGEHIGIQATLGTSLVRYHYEFSENFGDPALNYTIVTTYHDQALRASLLFRFAFGSQEQGLFFTIGPELEKVKQPATLFYLYQGGQLKSQEYSSPYGFRPNTAAQISIGYRSQLSERLQWSIEPFGRFHQLNHLSPYFWWGHHISCGLRVGLWI